MRAVSVAPPGHASDPADRAAPSEPADAWTIGSALLAFVAVFATAGVAALIIVGLTGPSADGELRPGAAQLATLVQDLAMLGVPILIASAIAVGPARARDFGLRPIAARHLVPAVLVTFVGFAAFSLAYDALVDANGSQDTLASLGADDGGLLLVGAAVLVIVVAPFVEEFLFRGFMYRAARNRLGPSGAALLIGGLFGIVHLTDADTVPLIPVLAMLGAISCVLYERTGSLTAPIALHVLNNTLAFSLSDDVPDAAMIGPPLGVFTLAVVIVVASARRAPVPLEPAR